MENVWWGTAALCVMLFTLVAFFAIGYFIDKWF